MNTRPALLSLLGLALMAGTMTSCSSFPKEAQPYRAAAEQNNAEAQFQVGLAYYKSKDFPYRHAYPWFSKAAHQGHTQAMYYMALCNGMGRGTQKDINASFNWAKKGAAAGNADCYVWLGALYADGDITGQPERDLAIAYFLKAGEMGRAYAYGQAADQYERKGYEGYPKKMSDVQSLIAADKCYIKAAEGGATMFYGKAAEALITAGRYQEAWNLVNKGLDEENAQCAYALGLMFLEGKGVEKNMEMALRSFRLAAAHDNADAEAQLGHMYGVGEGVAKDRKLSASYYSRAIKHGLYGPALYRAQNQLEFERQMSEILGY